MSNNPHLVWIIEPETKIRFRYESEGGSHGGLAGKNGKKTYPTLELKNYSGRQKVIVRVSLYTEDYKEHVLEFKGKKNEGSKKFIEEPLQEDNTVAFKNIHILSKKKDVIEQILMERKLQNLNTNVTAAVRRQFEKRYSKDVKERARAILNSGRLLFEAFEVDRPFSALCSLYSDVICNQKAAAKGDLRICRLSRVAGNWKGGDEVFLLCDKVQKDNIKVKFYETNENDEVIWHDYGVFSPVDVHYQVAIIFKTPCYKSNEEKRVFICLERNGETSEPREFTYKPDEQPSTKKRKLDNFENGILTPETPESIQGVSFPQVSSPESDLSAGSGETQNPFSFLIADQNEDNILYSNINGILRYIMDENAVGSMDEIAVDNMDEIAVGEMAINTEDYRLPFLDLPNSVDVVDSNFDGLLMPEKIDQIWNQNSKNDNIMIDGILPKDDKLIQHSINLIDLRNLSLEDKSESSSRCLNKFVKKEPDQQKKNICSRLLLKRDSCGNTLLHMAVLAKKDILSILKMSNFLKIDIVNVQNHKNQTALHLAAEENLYEAVKILLKCGSNPNLKDSYGNNCYHIAVKNNFSYIVLYMIKFSQFPVNVAVHDFNDEGLTPVHIAVMQKNPDLFDLLKIHVTNANIKEKKAGKSLLHYAVDFQPSLLPRLLKMNNIDVNVQDFEGNTPLHIACASENVEAVRKLLCFEANPNIKNFKQNFNDLDSENSEEDSYGQIPADLTVNLEILKLLSAASKITVDDSLNFQNPDSFQVSDEIPCEVIEKLCNYLNEDTKWMKLVPIFFDEDILDSLNLTSNPAKALLDFIKKEDKETYLERLKTAFEIVELNEGVNIVTGSA